MSQVISQTISAPWGGYDTATPDAQLATNKCRRLENFLPGRPGRITLRGGMNRPTSTNSTGANTPTNWSGGWVFDDKLLHADMLTNPVGYMVTNWAPTTPTLSAKVAPVNLNVGLYPFHTRAGNYVYGFTAGSAFAGATTSLINRRTVNGSAVATDSFMLYWTGGNTAVDFVRYSATTMPRGSSSIITFLNRLWVLGGSLPGTATPVFNSVLYFSTDLGDGTTVLADAVASWQTGGVVNRIPLGGSDNDYGVATAILNGRLVVLRRQSVYMLTGTNPSNFQLTRIASIGCVDPGSVQEWDDGIYFMSDNGMSFFDGTTVHPVSGPVTDALLMATWQGGSVGELSVTRIAPEYMMITNTVGPSGASGVNALSPKCWILHVPTLSWATILAPTTFSTGLPTRVMRVTNYSLAYDGTYIYDTSFVANPEAQDVTLSGFDQSGHGGISVLIPGRMTTRSYRLAGLTNNSLLTGLWYEYILKSQPGNFNPPTFDLAVLKQDGSAITLLDDGTTSPGTVVGVDDTFGIKRGRPTKLSHHLRLASTVGEVQIDWKLSASNQTFGYWPVWCEIYDATLQFQPTNLREV